jgi:broad specificity phosphatase PhoE
VTVVVFETHATSDDNEAGIATGWRPGRLSAAGREQAHALGDRRRADGIDAVFSSDLARAVETAELAFSGSDIPLFLDWRLRECDYGELNGAPRSLLDEQRADRVDEPWPGGESWAEAVARVERALDDLPDGRVVVIGHVATR